MITSVIQTSEPMYRKKEKSHKNSFNMSKCGHI